MAAHDHNAVVDISVRRRVELSANNVDYVANYTLNYSTSSSDRGPTNNNDADEEPTTVRAVARFSCSSFVLPDFACGAQDCEEAAAASCLDRYSAALQTGEPAAEIAPRFAACTKSTLRSCA